MIGGVKSLLDGPKLKLQGRAFRSRELKNTLDVKQDPKFATVIAPKKV